MGYFRILFIFIFIFVFLLIPQSGLPKNFVPNPGFEIDKDQNGIPDFWLVEKDQYALYRIENGKKGKAISIFGKGKISCRLKGLKKNTYYLLSFYVKRDGWKEGEYPKIKVFGKEIVLNELIAWGDWVRLSFLINSSSYTETTLSLIDPNLSHKISFDEVVLSEFIPTPLFPNDKVYSYYPVFKWSLPKNNFVLSYEIEVSRSQDFREKLVLGNVICPWKNSFTVDLPLDAGTWFWRVKVYKNRRLISVSKPAHFCLIPYFPIGIFGVPSKYIHIVKKAGFNSIYTGIHSIRSLLQLSKTQMNLLLTIPSELNSKKTQLFLRKATHIKNILAWYLRDEPEIWFVPPKYIWEMKRYVKALDPKHPTLITLVRAEKVEDYGPCADIIMVDPYPIPRRPVTWLSESIDRVKKLFPYKPVWAVIQAFDWSAFPYGNESRSWGRDPTYEEERCLTYLAIIHGARGLFYYTFKSKNYFIMERKRHWNELKKVIEELNNIYPIIVSPTIFPVKHVAYSEDKAIHYIIKKSKHRFYLLSVNVTPHFKEATLRLSGIFLNGRAKEIFQKRAFSIKKGLLKTRFSPYQVQVYEISPLTHPD